MLLAICTCEKTAKNSSAGQVQAVRELGHLVLPLRNGPWDVSDGVNAHVHCTYSTKDFDSLLTKDNSKLTHHPSVTALRRSHYQQN